MGLESGACSQVPNCGALFGSVISLGPVSAEGNVQGEGDAGRAADE